MMGLDEKCCKFHGKSLQYISRRTTNVDLMVALEEK